MTVAYCFDLDGTLTTQELLPLIASSVGLEDEISVLTKATMDGLLPFDKSFKLRVQLLKEAKLNWIHSAVENVLFHDDILRFIQSKLAQCFVITGNLDIWVKPLLDKLGIQSFTSRAAMDKDRVVGVEKVLHKGDIVAELRERFERIIVIGEGMNDVPMFEAADCGIAFGGTHAPNNLLVKLSDFIVNDGKSLCRLLTMLS